MKTARTVIALTAGAAALGFLAPSVASANSVEGYSPLVADTAISSLSSARGVSETAAARILAVQEAGAAKVDTLTSRLGGSAVDGYLDANGRPVVNVLDQRAASEVRAAGATAKVVDHSAAALEKAKSALEAVPAVTHTSIGVDPQANEVVVTIADAADDAAAARLVDRARALGDVVTVEHSTEAMHTAVYNGEAITGGGIRCSAGFNANSGGQNYIVDAGHCTAGVANWDGIGPSVDASFPGNDYGLIQNDSGDAPGAVTLWDGTTQAITSAGDPTVGQQICKSGSTTNLTCGTVTATGVTVNYAEGAVDGLIETDAAVNSGDSGGCLFSGGTGVGITSGMGGGSSFFQPVTEALSNYGVSLN